MRCGDVTAGGCRRTADWDRSSAETRGGRVGGVGVVVGAVGRRSWGSDGEQRDFVRGGGCHVRSGREESPLGSEREMTDKIDNE